MDLLNQMIEQGFEVLLCLCVAMVFVIAWQLGKQHDDQRRK